jgi:nitrate reductase beta subunit
MRPEDLLINAIERFSIGIDYDSGKYYFSIPVANLQVDYEEYYEISQTEYENLTTNPSAAIQFAADCRAHRSDNRLMVKPGKDRGI